MPDFKELVKNLYTSKNRELTEDKLKYIETNYKGKETEFVKNFYATIGEELPKEKFDYISNTYLKKKVGTETSTSTSTSKTDNTELAPKSGSLESPSPIKKFEGFSQSDLKKLGGPKKTAQEIPVLPENLKKVINDPENIARVNNLKKQELAKFRESTSINELDNQDIKNEFLAKQNNEGLLNKAKAAAQSLGGFLTSGSFGSTDLLIDEKKEARNQLIKQGIKKPSEEEVLKVAENIFTKKKSEGLKKDKISNYLENLDPAIKTILGADAEVKYKTLDKENTKVLNRMATNKVAFESYLDDLENPNLLPKDRVIIEQLRDETAKQLDKDLKLFNSNTDKVGSLKEEFEVFKKNYDTMENLAMRVGTSIADAGVNLLSGTGYLSSLNPGDVLGQIRNIQTQEIVNKAKANLNEIKSQYRPESEELTTDNWANYVTDVMANQSGTLLTMATTGGVGGATLLGVGGAGEKYNEIYNENKKGAGYSPLQMAVTPFLSGVSTGILSELPTAKTLMGTKRLFTAAINEGKKEVIDQAIKQTSKKIAKEVLDNYKREIPTELLDNLVQNTIDKDILGKDVGYWDNTWKTLKDTAIMTTVFSSGALPHVALAGVKMFTKPEQNKMLDDNGKKIIELSKQLNNPNLDETSRKVIENQIDKATIENSQIVNSTLDKIANLPDADVKKVVDNNRKEIKIKQEANVVKENESIEPNTKKIILDGLKNDYIQTVEQTKSIIDAEAKPQEVVEQKSETQPKTKEQEKVAEVENVSLTNEENKPTSIEKTEANTTEKVNIKESKNQKNSFGNNLPKDQKRFDITNKGSVEGEILLKEVKYNGKGYYEVVNFNVENKNKGIGTEAYKKLIKTLDKPLHSDMVRTPQAERVWQKLEEQGLAKKSEDGLSYETTSPSNIKSNGNVSVGTSSMEQVGIEQKPTAEVTPIEKVQSANDVKPTKGKTKITKEATLEDISNFLNENFKANEANKGTKETSLEKDTKIRSGEKQNPESDKKEVEVAKKWSLKGRTPMNKRKFKGDMAKANAIEPSDVRSMVLSHFLRGAKVASSEISQQGELKAKNNGFYGIATSKGKTIDDIVHDIWESEENQNLKADTYTIKDMVEEVISTHNKVQDVAESILKGYGIEVSENKQEFQEDLKVYQEVLEEEKPSEQDLMEANLLLAQMTDAEILELVSEQEKSYEDYLKDLEERQVIFEFGPFVNQKGTIQPDGNIITNTGEFIPKQAITKIEYVNKKEVETPKQEVKKTTKPDATLLKEVDKKIEDARQKVRVAKDALDRKAKSLDKEMVKDQENLFGERKSSSEAKLFDERVNADAREKATETERNNIKIAQEELKSLIQTKKDIESGKINSNQVDLEDVVNEENKQSEIKPEKKRKIYNSSPKKISELGKRTGVAYFATNKREAEAYAQMNYGKTREFEIKESDITKEDYILEKIKSLNLKTKDGTEIEDSILYELIDDRFDNSLEEKDIKKLFNELKKEGINAFEYTDDTQVIGGTTTSIAIIDNNFIKSLVPEKQQRKEKANAEVDKIAQKVKDLLPGIKDPDVKAQGFTQDQLIDLVASAVKNLISAGIEIDEAIRQVSASIKDRFGIEVNVDDVKAKLEPKVEQEPFERKEGKKSVLTRAATGNSSMVKKAISKYSLDYEIESQEVAKANADKFVEEVGITDALTAVRNNDIKGAEKAFVYDKIIQEIQKQVLNASESEISELEELHTQVLGEIFNEFDIESRNAGRFISALGKIYSGSEGRYNLSKRVKEYKALNNGEIPADILQKFKDADEKIKELEVRLAEAEKIREEQKTDRAIEEIIESISRRKKIDRSKGISDKAKAKAFADKLRSYKTTSKGTLSAATPFSLAYDGAIEIIATSIEAGGKISDAIKQGLEYIRKQNLNKDEENQAIAQVFNAFEQADSLEKGLRIDDDGKLRIPHSIIREKVENGIDNIEDLVTAIQEDLSEIYPDEEFTDRMVRDAITDYGKVSNPTREDIEVQISVMKSIGKLVSGLEDAYNGKRPLRSGLQRRPFTLEERAMQRKLKELLRDLPMDDADLSKSWKTALDSIKSRLRNEIADLDQQIANGEKRKGEKKQIEYDQEANELKFERDAKKATLDELVGKPELTEEERIDKATILLQKSIDGLQEKIDNGEIDYKKKPTPVTSAKLEEMRNTKKALLKQMEQMRQDAGLVEMKRLETAKKTRINRIKELQRRLDERDFSVRTPKPLPIDAELLEIESQLQEQKAIYEKEKYLKELEDRSWFRKKFSQIVEAFGVTRLFKAGGEFSQVLVQQGFLTPQILASRPKEFFKAMGRLGKAFLSPDKARMYEAEMKAHPLYPLMQKTKLSLTGTDHKLDAQEESYQLDLVNDFWNMIGDRLNKATNNKEVYTFTGLVKKLLGKDLNESDKKSLGTQFKEGSLWKMFERGAVTYSNYIKILKFEQGVKELQKDLKDPINDIEDYKKVANYINIFSGRANLGKAEMISKDAALVVFSLRNWYSQIQQLNPAYYIFTLGNLKGVKKLSDLKDVKPTVAQKMAVKSFMTSVIAITGFKLAFLAIANAGKDDDEEKWKMEYDPRSSDFGKLRKGKTTFDMWHGLNGLIVLYARIYKQQTKNSKTGEIKELGKGFGTPTTSELLVRYSTNKLAPSAGYLWRLGNTHKEIDPNTRKEYRVDPYGNVYGEKEMMDLFVPIYWNAINEIRKEDPDVYQGFLTSLGFLGMSVGTDPKGEKFKELIGDSGQSERPERKERKERKER